MILYSGGSKNIKNLKKKFYQHTIPTALEKKKKTKKKQNSQNELNIITNNCLLPCPLPQRERSCTAIEIDLISQIMITHCGRVHLLVVVRQVKTRLWRKLDQSVG